MLELNRHMGCKKGKKVKKTVIKNSAAGANFVDNLTEWCTILDYNEDIYFKIINVIQVTGLAWPGLLF